VGGLRIGIEPNARHGLAHHMGRASADHASVRPPLVEVIETLRQTLLSLRRRQCPYPLAMLASVRLITRFGCPDVKRGGD